MFNDLLRKKRFRQRMIRRRAGIKPVERAKADHTIQELVLKHWDNHWKIILIYVNQPHETATISLILQLIREGKKVCVPAFDRDGNSYRPSELRDFKSELEPGNFGVLEPKPCAQRPVPLEEVDVIFVPGVAFDRRGNRLGYGRGYFDRICGSTRAFKIGLAYASQIVDQLPARKEDVPMHWIVTEKGLIECRKL